MTPAPDPPLDAVVLDGAAKPGLTLKFDAFISYSRKDVEFAKRLERALRTYRPPRDLPVPQRHLSIFRDQTDISGVELDRALEVNLRNSAKLIVLCSPDSRSSPYVNREIEEFGRIRGPEHIIPLLVHGVPNNEARADQHAELAFPEALVTLLASPLAAEFRGFRPGKDRIGHGAYEQGWYKTLADLYSDYQVTRGQIEQREKRRRARQRAIVVSVTAAVMAVLVALTIWALYERTEAIHQRDIAISRQLASQADAAIGDRPDLALLLAAAAYRNAPTAQARQSLHASFLQRPRLRTFLWGHSGDITDVAFSPDGRRLAAGGDEDRKVTVWDVAGGVLRIDVVAHADRVQRVAFTPDGTRLISAGKDGQLKVWDARTGAPVRAFGHGGDFLETFALRPDGRVLVTGLWGGALEAWSVETGSRLASAAPHTGTVQSVEYSLDGATIASGSQDGTVALWDGAAEHHPRIIARLVDGVKDVALTPDGKLLAVAFGTGRVGLWDVETGRMLEALTPADSGHDKSEGASLAFSPDGTRLAMSGTLAGTITVWDVPTRRIVTALRGHESGVHAIAFSHHGGHFASVAGDAVVRVWETGGWSQLASATPGTSCLAFSPDDRTLATCGRDRAALWDVEEPGIMATLRAHTGQVGTIRFSPDGAHLASASDNRDVVVWDVAARKPIATYQLPPEPYAELEPVYHGKWLRVFAFSPDGQVIATGGRGGKSFGEGGRRGDLVLWRFADGASTPLDGHPTGVTAVAFAPDGRRLAASDSRTVRLWDVRTGEGRVLRESGGALSLAFDRTGARLAAASGDNVVLWDLRSGGEPAILRGHERPVTQVLFSSDGKMLLSASFDGAVRAWDVERAGGAPRWQVRHAADVTVMAISADGRVLATGSRDRTVGLWDTESGESLHTLTGHRGAVRSVALSPDGAVVASAGDDGHVILWDVATGNQIVELGRGATTLALSPDGRLLAAGGSADGRITLWNVLVPEWADRACAVANRNLTRAEWRQYLGDTPYRAVCPGLPAPSLSSTPR